MRPYLLGSILVAILAATAARADLFSKSYAFKAGTRLEIGLELEGGVRIDAVRFVLPDPGQGQDMGSPARAEIEISNLGTKPAKIGIAIALLDAENRLVAAANGGTKMFALRTERQMKYSLTFDGVYSEVGTATQFKLAVEPK
jgi:hypothetical protein